MKLRKIFIGALLLTAPLISLTSCNIFGSGSEKVTWNDDKYATTFEGLDTLYIGINDDYTTQTFQYLLEEVYKVKDYEGNVIDGDLTFSGIVEYQKEGEYNLVVYFDNGKGIKKQKDVVVKVVKNSSTLTDEQTIKYTITFKNDDGTILEQKKVPIGSKIKYTGSKPEKEPTAQRHFVFSNWSSTLGIALEDKTFYANYTSKKHSLTTYTLDSNEHMSSCSECSYSKVEEHTYQPLENLLQSYYEDKVYEQSCTICSYKNGVKKTVNCSKFLYSKKDNGSYVVNTFSTDLLKTATINGRTSYLLDLTDSTLFINNNTVATEIDYTAFDRIYQKLDNEGNNRDFYIKLPNSSLTVNLDCSSTKAKSHIKGILFNINHSFSKHTLDKNAYIFINDKYNFNIKNEASTFTLASTNTTSFDKDYDIVEQLKTNGIKTYFQYNSADEINEADKEDALKENFWKFENDQYYLAENISPLDPISITTPISLAFKQDIENNDNTDNIVNFKLQDKLPDDNFTLDDSKLQKFQTLFDGYFIDLNSLNNTNEKIDLSSTISESSMITFANDSMSQLFADCLFFNGLPEEAPLNSEILYLGFYFKVTQNSFNVELGKNVLELTFSYEKNEDKKKTYKISNNEYNFYLILSNNGKYIPFVSKEQDLLLNSNDIIKITFNNQTEIKYNKDEGILSFKYISDSPLVEDYLFFTYDDKSLDQYDQFYVTYDYTQMIKKFAPDFSE